MSKLIRRKKEIGAALAVALQLTTLTLIGVIAHFTGGPQQSVNAPAASQITADQNQTQNVQAPTGTDRSALRASAVYANKVSGPRASQIFNLATSRAESAQQGAQRSMQESELPNEATLTTDQEDYPPYSYVYMTGTGFQPGETVDMIVVELDPTQESFEPWQVVADENGEIHTSWYIFSTDFIGATLQATATGESSQLTASATFTDASGNGTMTVTPTSVSPGSTNNSFTFQFRALNGGGNAYGANSFATVVVPAGWTAPTTTSGQPGFVNATAVGTATVGAISVVGNTITVPFTASGTTNGFSLTYGVGTGAAVTAPCATGAYTFTTNTSQNGNPVAQVAPSPLVFDGVGAALAAGAFGASSNGNLNSVTSNPVTATAGQTLLILVTAEDDSNGATRSASVGNTSGANPLSGGSATLITTNAASSNSWVCSGNDCFFMYAFRATATGTSGTVTATFPTNVKNAAIDVIALSGNDTSNPIIQSGINSGNSSSPNWNLSGALTPGSSMLLFGDTTNFATPAPTWSNPPSALFTPVDSFSEIDGARSHNLVNYFGGPSALSVSGSLSASARWGTIAIEIRPATSPPPSCLPCTPPSVTAQPSSTAVPYGTASVSFSAAASGNPTPGVQWQVSTNGGGSFSNLSNGGNVSGATTTTLTISNPTVASPALQYQAVFTNTCSGTQTATSNAATLTVNRKNLTISGAVANNKQYDGSTSATADFTGASLVGVVPPDVVTINSSGYTASFADKNVGSGKAVTVTGVTLSGAAAGNYTVSQPSGLTANITAKHITGSFTADNKVYDGTTAATVLTRSLSGVIAPDVVTLNGGTAAFADKNVGNGKAVTLTGANLSGADAGNYILDSVATTTANITALHITGSFTAGNKVYDGTTAATVLTRSTVGDVGGVSLSGGTATFADKNVGAGKTVTLAGATLTGVDAANYVLDSVASTTADITARDLTVTATGINKVYDGNTSATVTLSTDKVSGDAVLASYTTASFADKNVGIGKTVSVIGISISGADAVNYNLLNTTAGATADITARDLTVTATGINKVYDGNTSATVTLSTDKVSGDAVLASYTTASFADKNVGIGKTVSVIGISISGADAVNYNLLNTTAGATADITARDLTVTATGINKVYDGNTSATVTLSTDKVSGDAVLASYTTASFADKNVGIGKTVSVIGISISGADAVNYNLLNTTAGATADITARDLTVTATGINKVYDGNTSATVTLSTDKVSGDAVLASYTTASFADKNVGIGKTVSVIGISISGADAVNYNLLNTTAGATADITARDLTVTATGINKVYDGNTSATVTLSTDKVSGDAVLASYTTASFADKNVGIGKTVSVIGISISGADAVNYNLLNTTAGATADITARDLTVTATGINKVYDGNTSATVTLSTDKVSGDAVLASYTTASFADKNVGIGKTVSVIGISISGADAVNYNLLNTTAGATANITVLHITGTFTAASKIYDGNTSAMVLTRSLVGAIVGDAVSLTGGTATFSDKNVGNGKTVTLAGASLSGGDAGNYVLDLVATTTANITVLHITGSFTAANKVYDANTSATVLTRSLVGAIIGDAVSLTGGTATFSDPNAAMGKTVTLTGASLSGTDAGSYVLDSVATTTANIAKASTTTTITSDNPDPSIIGQAYAVHWTVSPQIGGTPTGTVTVSDGTASCSAAVSGFCTLTSTTAGPKTLTATYSGDANFLTGSDTESHNVSYTFIGFFPPIDNIPVVNQVKAGQTIPVKWQLKDYAGNIICDLNSLAPNGLNSVRINCDSNEPIDDIEELAPPGGTVFRCDGTQFIYNWQTTKSWAGTCRQLQVTLADGHTYVANFKFK